jgi:hypothetical protein
MITSVLWGLATSAVVLWFAYYLWTRAESLAHDEATLFGRSRTYETTRRWGYRAGALVVAVGGAGLLLRVVAEVVD